MQGNNFSIYLSSKLLFLYFVIQETQEPTADDEYEVCDPEDSEYQIE